jgi:3-deoxy-manno-octulosonate cytidylyltransferase (CMP-KDO synthetase)
LAEVAATLDHADVIVNVQGDEPLISPVTIERAVDELINADEAQIVTSSEAITNAGDVLSPDVVKVVVDAGGRALYFSRLPIPYPRDAVKQFGSLDDALRRDPSLLGNFRKHTGLYVYRRGFLLEYKTWEQSELERTESLEQLRALERGVIIKVIEADAPSIGVDTLEDLDRVREIVSKKGQRLEA